MPRFRTWWCGSRRRGVALAEVVVAAVIACVLVALLIPMADRQRRLARLGEDLASFRQIAAWTSTYTSDFNDQFWHFSWRPGTQPWSSSDPFAAGLTSVSGTTLSAVSSMQRAEMTYLVRRGLNDPTLPNLQSGASTFMSIRYGHVPLLAHMGAPMPGRVFTSAADATRPIAEDLQGFRAGLYPQVPSNETEYRLAFIQRRSAWPAWWDRGLIPNRIALLSLGSSSLFPSSEVRVNAARMSDVLWPSYKVMMSERHDWYHAGMPWPIIAAQARAPFLFADGHVSIRTSRDANLGGDPNSGQTYVMTYSADAFDPPPPPQASGSFAGAPRFISTINGIRGRDFGAPQPAWVP